MDQIQLSFYHVNPKKTAVCFTFDDNFARHSELIAPAFLQRSFRCTFYLNPGEDGFAENHLNKYLALSHQGFEIGSHGFVHDNLSKLSPAEAEKNLRDSARSIQELFQIYPATFAFPYHDFSNETLAMARACHIETRNTLADSIWVPIKTAIPLGDMLTAVEQCIEESRPLVFSGHSVILTPEEANDERLKNETGYNPILFNDLCALLDDIKERSAVIQVLTFEQAALLAYIQQNGAIDGDSFLLSEKSMNHLEAFGIGVERLSKLM